MILMKRNTRTIHYALYSGRGEPILDSDGYETGEKEILYEDPVAWTCNVGAIEKGESWVATFGIEDNYDRVIITDDMDCPVDENSILWVDVTPDEAGTVPHDYTVWRVSRYLNHIAYAVQRVDADV